MWQTEYTSGAFTNVEQMSVTKIATGKDVLQAVFKPKMVKCAVEKEGSGCRQILAISS